MERLRECTKITRDRKEDIRREKIGAKQIMKKHARRRGAQNKQRKPASIGKEAQEQKGEEERGGVGISGWTGLG